MAITQRYSQKEIDEFYQWNMDLSKDELQEWIIELMPQPEFDCFMREIKIALHEEIKNENPL